MIKNGINYAKKEIWDVVWSRPYNNYRNHHSYFWNKIRNLAMGRILDLGCGPACIWEKTTFSLTGVDFSPNAILEAKKNNPGARFLVGDIRLTPSYGEYDTIVLSGVVNYYEDLEMLKKQIKARLAPRGRVIITINVIDDFPGRHWDEKRIFSEFGSLGKQVNIEFKEKVGFLLWVDN